jgi:predicted TIM-barrel fold metal-dependent hydrolase
MSNSRREFIKKNSITLLGTTVLAANPGNLLASTADFLLPQTKDLLFFDAFARIGPRRYKHPGEKWQLEDLIKELSHCSISGALVASTLSLSYDAMYSNLELSNNLKPYPNLFGIWNVLPHHTNECLPPAQLMLKMAEHNVRAVTIHPASNGWDWSAQSSQELMKYLNDNKVFTITNVSEIGGWKEMNTFLTRYKSIPLLVSGISWGEQRYAIGLLKDHPNFHISFDRMQINEGLEFLYKKGHINQLVFATDAPTMSAGAHRTYIDYADIPDEAKANVAGGNLIRLLGGQRPPKVHINRSEDILMSAVRNGKPLPVPVIDMHMHMLHEGINGAGGTGYHMENGGPKGIFKMMERLGCVGGGFMSWNGVVSNDSVQGNKLVKEALNASPKGFWGLATFSPTHYTQEQLAEMIPQVYSDKRIIGMKPYHFYGMEYFNPAYDIWWEYGNKNGLYGLIHPSRSDLLEVDKLAEKYKNVRWVIAHAGGSYKMADMAIAVMKKHKNVFAEITLTPVPLGVIEYMVDAVGDDRILYGSDLPMRDPRQQLGWLVFSNLPLASKKKILGENAYAVIEPCIKNMPEYNVPVVFRK